MTIAKPRVGRPPNKAKAAKSKTAAKRKTPGKRGKK